MSDFEEKVRGAFEEELSKAAPAADLRQRVIGKAVRTPRNARLAGAARTVPSPWNPFRQRPRLTLVTSLVVAACLVVAAVGIYANTRSSTRGTAVRSSPSATVLQATMAFGKLPAPALHPNLGLGGGGPAAGRIPYFGPAKLTWRGPFPKVGPIAPVIRYPTPDVAAADAFAARFGARPGGRLPGAAPGVRSYIGPQDFQLSIGPRDASGIPMFSLSRSGPPGPTSLSESQAKTAADDLLAQLGLTPAWPYRVTVGSIGIDAINDHVVYQRLIDLGAGARAGLVDGQGDPLGMEVFLAAGPRVVQIIGVLSGAEQVATYPLRGDTAAVQSALAAPPLPYQTTVVPGQVPAITLTHTSLVYSAVLSGSTAVLEPAYLFTGPFDQGYEKRVLVPAVASSAILP
jgi:hypothetical protein